ncbi:hypothetical protein AAKU67_001896 [Oxalobacteraceae bacterium GrIS 2.11]
MNSNSIQEMLRDLTRDFLPQDHTQINYFQNHFGIEKDSTLMLLFVIWIRDRRAIEKLPEMLEQKARVTIELHQQTLRDQSVLISKELIGVIATQIKSNNNGTQDKLFVFSCGAAAGVIFCTILLFLHFMK